MMLNNLSQLGAEIQEKIKNYDNRELTLSDDFKNEFKSYLSLNSKDKIEFQKFTTIVTTPKELKVIFPNQWFYIASFFSDFLNSLWKYKGIVNDLKLTEQTIKDLRKSTISTELKSTIQTIISDENDYAFFELFLTNYDWWYGSKTIDRGDFFVSSVLNLSKVVNVSHSYLADLAYYFSKEDKLTDLLAKDYEVFFKNTEKQNANILIEEKKLRTVLLKTFKYILERYGENIVLKDIEIKEAKIGERNYDGITIPKYFGFEVLVGMFNEKQTTENLKSSETLRFIDDEININNNSHSYFTSQWNENNGRGLSLINFNRLLCNISDNSLEIVKEENVFKLIEKANNKSPLINTTNTIYYGAPGTGKSYKVEQIIKTLDSHFYERITFHPEFDNASFVGGYRPVSREITCMNSKDEEYTISEVHYKFVPQSFTNIYVRAWNDLNNQYYLVIEEINRGNCAEIFGDIFQLLDRKSNYTVSASNELQEHLNKVLVNKNGINNGLKLPPNLSIYATMNTSDQSLFPMDSAFKRRWDWEYVPICYDNIVENDSFGYEVQIDGNTYFKWVEFIREVNKIIKTNPNLGMDKCIGNYFIKSDSKQISLKEFINKAIFYLWNDVFKDEDSSDSIFEKGTTYEDFFPLESNGKEVVSRILNTLKVESVVKAKI